MWPFAYSKHLLLYSGSPTWTRTRDLRINSPSLYRLSYQGIEVGIITAQRVSANVQGSNRAQSAGSPASTSHHQRITHQLVSSSARQLNNALYRESPWTYLIAFPQHLPGKPGRAAGLRHILRQRGGRRAPSPQAPSRNGRSTRPCTRQRWVKRRAAPATLASAPWPAPRPPAPISKAASPSASSSSSSDGRQDHGPAGTARPARTGAGLLIGHCRRSKRKRPHPRMRPSFTSYSGSPTWTRTRDLRINSPSLYRLSYQGIVLLFNLSFRSSSKSQ